VAEVSFDRAELIAELVRDEGRRLMPYVDTAGKITIGVGRNLTDLGISLGECAAMLDKDIARAELGLDHALPWWRELDGVRQRVLLNMAFNLGLVGLSSFRATLGAIKEARFTDAAAGMQASLWARQVGRRAERLARMMESGAT
jgi:lysozyme